MAELIRQVQHPAKRMKNQHIMSLSRIGNTIPVRRKEKIKKIRFLSVTGTKFEMKCIKTKYSLNLSGKYIYVRLKIFSFRLVCPQLVNPKTTFCVVIKSNFIIFKQVLVTISHNKLLRETATYVLNVPSRRLTLGTLESMDESHGDFLTHLIYCTMLCILQNCTYNLPFDTVSGCQYISIVDQRAATVELIEIR